MSVPPRAMTLMSTQQPANQATRREVRLVTAKGRRLRREPSSDSTSHKCKSHGQPRKTKGLVKIVSAKGRYPPNPRPRTPPPPPGEPDKQA